MYKTDTSQNESKQLLKGTAPHKQRNTKNDQKCCYTTICHDMRYDICRLKVTFMRLSDDMTHCNETNPFMTTVSSNFASKSQGPHTNT